MLHACVDSVAADMAACRHLLRHGSRTFHAASLVLPPQVRQPATALYAFCRLADDAIDLGVDRTAALRTLRERLERIYVGQAVSNPVDRAFSAVVKRFAIPKTLPEALLEGFEWDAQGRQYETLTELQAYAARVAGTVGSMMALLMDVRAADVVARACDLGVAMQLTNIARDVGEDARLGRLYLPREWLREESINPDHWLANPVFDAALARVIKRLLNTADELYARATLGIAWLPATCRPGMQAARLLYAEIGREVERLGMNSVAQRAHVSWQRKLQILPQAMWAAIMPRRALPSVVLDEVRFLVNAAAAPMANVPRTKPALQPVARVVWLLDLFERLEREELALARKAH
jgi:15-cis-phytoene synthase